MTNFLYLGVGNTTVSPIPSSGVPITPFVLFFDLIAVVIAVFALGMASFPRKITQWRMRGPDGTTEIEPGRALLLVMRIGGVVVAAIAVLMAVGTTTIFL